ncbi:MAG: IS256 family transposase [Rhizobiales bacterium]|nr:IS256 family transposase [Hyphomicrobiales bacterium]
MPQRAATITSLPVAYEAVKAMEDMNFEAGEGYRVLAREALADVIEAEMEAQVDAWLEGVEREGGKDRRNGSYPRHFLTALGDIEIAVPRTRKFSAHGLLKAYARRGGDIDQIILQGFALGLSTRKVGEALLAILGRPVSPQTVSRVARTLDQAAEAFHRRKLKDVYQALVFDGVTLARKTGAGAVRRPVLVALGIHRDGRKEVIDYRLAASESAADWGRFLADLHRRGLTGQGLDMICADGGKGLIAALPDTYPGIPLQRCWAHKMRNILAKVRRPDQDAVKRAAHKVMNAETIAKARSAARVFADRFEAAYPAAVACLRDDLDDLLTCFIHKDQDMRKRVRTTNAIERRFKEVRRRTRPMGTFQDKTSMDRILFSIFTHENKSQGVSTLFPLTHNS